MAKFFNGWVKPHIFSLLIAAVGVISSYAVQSNQVRVNTDRIQQLERDSITPREYQELLRRLERIEGKLDELRAAPPRTGR
jgi:hypothetical protein